MDLVSIEGFIEKLVSRQRLLQGEISRRSRFNIDKGSISSEIGSEKTFIPSYVASKERLYVIWVGKKKELFLAES